MSIRITGILQEVQITDDVLIQVGRTHENRFRRYSRDILSDDDWNIIREVSTSWKLKLEEWDEWMSRVGQL